MDLANGADACIAQQENLPAPVWGCLSVLPAEGFYGEAEVIKLRERPGTREVAPVTGSGGRVILRPECTNGRTITTGGRTSLQVNGCGKDVTEFIDIQLNSEDATIPPLILRIAIMPPEDNTKNMQGQYISGRVANQHCPSIEVDDSPRSLNDVFLRLEEQDIGKTMLRIAMLNTSVPSDGETGVDKTSSSNTSTGSTSMKVTPITPATPSSQLPSSSSSGGNDPPERGDRGSHVPSDLMDIDNEDEDFESVSGFPKKGLCKRRDLQKWLEKRGPIEEAAKSFIKAMEEKYMVSFTKSAKASIRDSIERFPKKLREKKRELSYKQEAIVEFLSGIFIVKFTKQKQPDTVQPAMDSEPQGSRGRPRKDYEQLKQRAKQQRKASLYEHQVKSNIPTGEAIITLIKKSDITQKSDLVDIIQYCLATPTKPSKAIKRLKTDSPIQLTAEEAYGVMLDTGISINGYMKLRSICIRNNSAIFPSYNKIRPVKKAIRPKPEDLTVSDLYAKVKLQSLLDLTISRIIELQDQTPSVLQQILQNGSSEFTLICSWGFDGSTGQSNYKQKYSNETFGPELDSSLFATTLIPLQIVQNNTNLILWRNTVPQSVRFVRPIELDFVKESKTVVLDKKKAIDTEIAALIPYCETRHGMRFSVSYELHMTIIDGKVLNFITGTHSTNCPICHCTPKEFNVKTNFSNGKFAPKDSGLMHGVSPLHAFIRFLENLLHVSYKLDNRCTRSTTEAQKQSALERKYMVQARLFKEMGLRVDFVRQGGAGSSNDGNTARRAFRDHKKFADILEIDADLVKRLRIVLVTISHNLTVNPDAFEEYCRRTTERYIDLYGWYKMSPTMHKVLVHGADIIRKSALPVGMLSEQGAESKNKYYRLDRNMYTRKTSRIATMTDLFNRSVDFSDPLLSFQSMKHERVSSMRLPLEREAIELLMAPEPPQSSALSQSLFENEDVPDDDVLQEIEHEEEENENAEDTVYVSHLVTEQEDDVILDINGFDKE